MTYLNESELKNECIKLYVASENSKKHKGRKAYYENFCNKLASYLYKVYAGNTYNEVVKDKQFSDMHKKFYKEVMTTGLQKKDCYDFGEYFYRKFLDDIKEERKRLKGSPYSKNVRVY